MITLEQRMAGGLWGSLVGDALGVPVEFQGRDARKADPVTGMRAFGTYNQPAGTWSDDGALLLCSAESLVAAGFDTQDMGRRFLRWYDGGHWAAHGKVFDIGNTTARALGQISDGTPAEEAGGTRENDNGNGSLMRILPVALASLKEADSVFADRLERASAITHGHPRSRMACVFFGLVVRSLVEGVRPEEAINAAAACFEAFYQGCPELGAFRVLCDRDLVHMAEHSISSGGYVMDTLTASLWCLLTTSTFAEAVLRAVNLGWDTDTTGCVTGGLAGVWYGIDAIPSEWRQVLPRQAELTELTRQFNNHLAAP